MIEIEEWLGRRGRHAWFEDYVVDVVSATSVTPTGVALYRQLAQAMEWGVASLPAELVARSACADPAELVPLLGQVQAGGLIRLHRGGPGRLVVAVAGSVRSLSAAQVATLPPSVHLLGHPGCRATSPTGHGPVLRVLAGPARPLRFEWSHRYVCDVLGVSRVRPVEISVYRQLARAVESQLPTLAAQHVAAGAGISPGALRRVLRRLSDAGLVEAHRHEAGPTEIRVSMRAPALGSSEALQLPALVQILHGELTGQRRHPCTDRDCADRSSSSRNQRCR